MPGPSSRNYYSCEHIWLSKEQWTMWHQHLQLLSHPGLFSLFMFIHRQGYTAIVNAVKWNCVYTHIWASFSRAGISAVLCHFFLVTVILYSPTFLPLPSSMYFSLYLSFLSLLWLSWPFPKISVFPRHSLPLVAKRRVFGPLLRQGRRRGRGGGGGAPNALKYLGPAVLVMMIIMITLLTMFMVVDYSILIISFSQQAPTFVENFPDSPVNGPSIYQTPLLLPASNKNFIFQWYTSAPQTKCWGRKENLNIMQSSRVKCINIRFQWTCKNIYPVNFFHENCWRRFD